MTYNKIDKVMERAEEVFGDSKTAKGWLNSKVWALGNKTPKEWIEESDEGFNLVMNELGRIEHGIVS